MRLKLGQEEHLAASASVALATDTRARIDPSKTEVLEAAGTVDVLAGCVYCILGFRPANSAVADRAGFWLCR